MDKKILREKIEGKLLKQQVASLKNKSFKQLVQEYYESIKNKAVPSTQKKNSTKEDILLEKKIRQILMEILGETAKGRKQEGDIMPPTEEEPPVADEMDMEDDGYEDEDVDVDVDDEDIGDEDEEDFDLEGDDEDFDLEDEDDLDLGDEGGEDLDLGGEDEDFSDSDIEQALADEDEDEDLDLGDEDMGDEDIDDEELDSEVNAEETPDSDLTEKQKKAIRMKRMKDKAIQMAKKKVSEEENNSSLDGKGSQGQPSDAFDPEDGVDATLAGNEALFDSVPDIDNTGLNMDGNSPADSDLGTDDESTDPNYPMDKTDAKPWNNGNPNAPEAEKATKQENKKWAVTKKTEKLNYKKLMAGDYFKRIDG